MVEARVETRNVDGFGEVIVAGSHQTDGGSIVSATLVRVSMFSSWTPWQRRVNLLQWGEVGELLNLVEGILVNQVHPRVFPTLDHSMTRIVNALLA